MRTKLTIKFIILVLGLMTILHSCYEDMLYPLADFKVRGGGIRPEYKIMLDASASISQEFSNDKLQYRWDLNGDHKEWETDWINSAFYTVLLPGIGSSRFMGLQVKYTYGLITEIYNDVQINHLLYSYTVKDVLIDGNPIKSINYQGYKQIWLVDNIKISSSEGVTNDTIHVYGSYLTWAKANEKISSDLILPSLKDWQDMIDQSGGIELAGYNMPIDVEHGLKLLYGGRCVDKNISEKNEYGYYWTSTEVDREMAYAIKLTKGSDRLEIVSLPKTSRLSVRLFSNYQDQQNK